MAKKGIDINPNTVIVAGTAVFGLILARQILISFGLLGGAGSKKVKDELTNPESPWKPTFWKNRTVPAILIRRAEAESYAKKIYDALNWYADDTAAVNGVFTALKTQSQVSFLADVFFQLYNQDLLTYLQEGSDTFPWNGLADDELLKLTNLVDRLPKYMPR